MTPELAAAREATDAEDGQGMFSSKLDEERRLADAEIAFLRRQNEDAARKVSDRGRTMWDFLAELDPVILIVALMVLMGIVFAVSESWQKAKSAEHQEQEKSK